MKKSKNFLCKKVIKYIFIIILSVIVINNAIMIKAENDEEKYYMDFYNDLDNDISIEIGTYNIVIDEAYGEIDLSNIIIMPLEESVHTQLSLSDSEISTITQAVREKLLNMGYAKLDDESIASEEELEAQEYAESNHLGIWEEKEDSSKITKSDKGKEDSSKNTKSDKGENNIVASVIHYLFENYQFIISVLASCGFAGFAINYFRKKSYTRKKVVLLGGANASGKTTLNMFLINPDASTEDLKGPNPTLKMDESRIVRDESNNKLILEAKIIDPPGHELQHIIDQLSRLNKERGCTYVAIIILSPTKKNNVPEDLNNDYILDQYLTLQKLWVPVLKAKTTVELEHVILFLNKKDLYEDFEKVKNIFLSHIDLIKKACNENEIKFSYISGSIIDRSGMTKLMTILKRG